MTVSPDPDDEALGRLIAEIEARRARGEEIDAEALAGELGLPVEVVRDGIAGFEGIEGIIEEPIDAEAPPPPELPEDLELVGELGRGGMGIVYRARQRSLDREVAVKVLCPGELVFGEAMRRFRRETQALAKLRHPHVVAIHEVGATGGNVWYVMDVFRESLADLLSRHRRPMPVAKVVKMLAQVADAVAHVHEHGLIHRDLKPANILLDESGDAHVADFGLAADPAAGATLTATGRVLGTPDYMAPEQALGERAKVDERTDVYALGAILYECLTGRTPFAGLPLVDKIHAVAHEEPLPPRQYRREVPKELERVCRCAMAKDPDERYATASAFREELVRFREGLPVTARSRGMGRRTSAFFGRHRGPLIASIATAVLLLTAFWFWFVRSTSETALRTAEELWTAGHGDAAAPYYERGWEEARDGGGDRASRFELGYGSVRARLARREAQGVPEDLARLAELVGDSWELDLRLALLTAAQVELVGGDEPALSEPCRAIARLRERNRRDDERPGDALTVLEPLLDDPADPTFEPAAAMILYRYPASSNRPFNPRHRATRPAADVFLDRGLPLADILPVLIEWREETPPEERFLLDTAVTSARFGDFRWAGDGRAELESRLASIVDDEAEVIGTRALAAQALAIGVDLPYRLPVGDRGVALWQSEVASAILDLWSETRNLPVEEAVKHRVAAILSMVERLEAIDGRIHKQARTWLVHHTGDWQILNPDWWENHRDRGPLDWLATNLELEADPRELGVEALVERLDGNLHREKLRLLHALLTMLYDGPGLPPYWSSDDSLAPIDLTESWRTLVFEGHKTGFVLHSAMVIRRDGVGAPELLASVRTPVARGQRFEQRLEFELFDRRATGGRPTPGGFIWNDPVPPVGVGRGAIEIEGRLGSSRLGLAGIGHRLTASWRPNVLRTNSREGFRRDDSLDEALFPIRSVCLQDLGALLEWELPRRRIVGCRHDGALLLRFEEEDGPRDRTWSLAEWVGALHDELGETLLEASGEKGPLPGGWTGVREDQGRALCYFPGTGLGGELKTFVDALENGWQRNRELERNLVTARLLIGDREANSLGGYLRGELDRLPWLPFASDVAISADPEIRGFAVPHLAATLSGRTGYWREGRPTAAQLERIVEVWTEAGDRPPIEVVATLAENEPGLVDWLNRPLFNLLPALLFGLVALYALGFLSRARFGYLAYGVALIVLLLLFQSSSDFARITVKGGSYGLVLLAVLLRFWSRRLERRPWPSLLILVALFLQELSPLSPRGDLLVALSDTSFVAAVAVMVVVAGRRGAWGLRWPAAVVYFPVAGQQLWVRYLCAFDELERATRVHWVSLEWTIGGIGMVAAIVLTVGLVSAGQPPRRALRARGRLSRARR